MEVPLLWPGSAWPVEVFLTHGIQAEAQRHFPASAKAGGSQHASKYRRALLKARSCICNLRSVMSSRIEQDLGDGPEQGSRDIGRVGEDTTGRARGWWSRIVLQHWWCAT